MIRDVIRADSDPARQTLFAYVMESRPLVRFVFGLHQRLAGTLASAVLVSCYGVASFLRIARPRNRRARILAVAQHENARRQVARVFAWIGPSECARVRISVGGVFSISAAFVLADLMWRGRLLALLRTIRAIDRRYGFLVSCRAAAGIAWYARSKAILRKHRPGAVLVSSDANPEEVGFVGAARSLGIPQVFISHAYPTPFSPPLDFSLSILEGEAALRARREKGPVGGKVLLAGIEGDSAPLDVRRFERAHPVIGIFPPKALSWTTLAAIITDCRQHYRPQKIVIRWHPSMLEPPRLAHVLSDLSGIVESAPTASLADVAQQCDWVVAGENSNVHLPVLKLGIPTIVVKGLGLYSGSRSDLYGFVAHGVVFPPVASVRDVRLDALTAFFSDQWSSRFEQYDASYLHPHGAIGSDVRRAIWALFDAPAQAEAR